MTSRRESVKFSSHIHRDANINTCHASHQWWPIFDIGELNINLTCQAGDLKKWGSQQQYYTKSSSDLPLWLAERILKLVGIHYARPDVISLDKDHVGKT